MAVLLKEGAEFSYSTRTDSPIGRPSHQLVSREDLRNCRTGSCGTREDYAVTRKLQVTVGQHILNFCQTILSGILNKGE